MKQRNNIVLRAAIALALYATVDVALAQTTAQDEDYEFAIEELRRGVYLEGRRTAEATVTRGATVRSGDTFTTKLVLTLREGRNRQVREMCARVGHPVRSLQRVRYGPLTLRGLPRGAWRDLTAAEVEALRAATR